MSSGLCVVTGGSRGIGRAVVHRMVAEGYDVMATGRDAEALAETAATAGGPVDTALLDVTDEEAVEDFLSARPVDVLVNNAGVAPSAPVHRTTTADWEWTMRVNATGPFMCTRAVLAGMKERDRGRIITVASVASHVGSRYTAAYTASKHAALGFIRVVAAEVAATGVTANAVCPGYVDTPMTDQSVARVSKITGREASEARSAITNMNASGRLVDPEAIANIVLMLCLPVNRDINGAAITIDGGTSA